MATNSEATCSKCGSTYRGEALKKLPVAERWGEEPQYEQRGDKLYRRFACLCEQNSNHRALDDASGMPVFVRKIAADEVLLKDYHASYGRAFSMRRGDAVARVVRRTGKSVWLAVDGGEPKAFDEDTGRARAKGGKIDEAALRAALAIAAKLPKTAAKGG